MLETLALAVINNRRREESACPEDMILTDWEWLMDLAPTWEERAKLIHELMRNAFIDEMSPTDRVVIAACERWMKRNHPAAMYLATKPARALKVYDPTAESKPQEDDETDGI